MSPSPNSEARKRGDARATPPPEPLPGYTLTTRGEAARAGWECIDLNDIPSGGACSLDNLNTMPFDKASAIANPWLVIARPLKPRKVTIELDEDVAQRWAGAVNGDLFPHDGDAVVAACRAALDGDK